MSVQPTSRSWPRLAQVMVLPLALVAAIGCDGPRRAAPEATPVEAPPNPAEQLLMPPVAQQPAVNEAPDNPPAAAGEDTAAAAGEAATVQTKADVGVGKRGRNLGQGIVATPIAAYFAAKEQIAFRVQIPEAMKLYKATNGYAPKSHEEFMKEIIQANNIPLPELPTGHRYLYNPQQEELMVEHPE